MFLYVCLGLDKPKGKCQHSITIDITLWEFESRKYCMTVIDASRQIHFHKHDYRHVLGCLAVLVVAVGVGDLETSPKMRRL
jgi:elongation factor 1-alpha